MGNLYTKINNMYRDKIEMMPLNQILDYIQPTKYLVKSTDYKDEYDIPVLTAGQTFILGYTDEKNGIYDASVNKPVIIFDDFTTSFHWVDFPFKVKSSAMKMLVVKDSMKEKIDFKYIFHYMSNIKYEPKEHSRQWIQTYSNFKIAVPPLEAQREIVHFLDEFSLLSAELSAELKARQQQYEYYRDKLLSFDKTAETLEAVHTHGRFAREQVKWCKLEEVAIEMYRGNGIKRTDVTETGIPCVRYGEIYTSYGITFDNCISHTKENVVKSKKYFEYGDVLFAITGESVEEIGKSIVYLGNEKCLAGGDMVVMKHNQNPKYMAFVLSTTQAQLQKSNGKVKSKVVHSSVPDLKKMIIPIPPLDIQEKIANILEKFYKLIYDISEGIPAEIEARQKQYEYYRNKLLSFEELKEA